MRVGRDALLLAVADDVLAARRCPAVYCARTAMFGMSSSEGSGIACRTLTFSLRTSSAVKFTGGSIATWQSSCSMWFWIRSRIAPALS